MINHPLVFAVRVALETLGLSVVIIAAYALYMAAPPKRGRDQ